MFHLHITPPKYSIQTLRKLHGWVKHFFLTLSVSSAKAECGFSILKSLKPSKQVILTSQHLQQQMLVNIDRLKIESLKPQESIDYWYKHSISKHRDRKAHAKRPVHGNTLHEKPGPKPKQTKLNFVTT